MSNVEDAKQPAVRNLESWKPYPWWFHGCQHHRHREPFAHDFDEVEVGPVDELIYHGNANTGLINPPVFKLPFFLGQWWLINREGFINPHLTLYLFAIFRPDPKMCVFLFIQMRENQKVWVWLRKRIKIGSLVGFRHIQRSKSIMETIHYKLCLSMEIGQTFGLSTFQDALIWLVDITEWGIQYPSPGQTGRPIFWIDSNCAWVLGVDKCTFLSCC